MRLTTEKKLIIAVLAVVLLSLVIFALFLIFAVNEGFFGGGAATEDNAPIMRHIFEDFALHERPDFSAPVLGMHAPRLVQILDQQGNGWAQVVFYENFYEDILIAGWTFLPPLDTIYLPRPMAYFANLDDARHAGLIGPGYFEVLESRMNWVYIVSEGTPLWVDLGFWPDEGALVDFFENFPYAVSVHYYNINTGFTFNHNEHTVYTSASLNKASHALYVYHLAEQGLADLNTIHTLRASEIRGGTGTIRHFARAGHTFTHKELLRHSVADSDNTAFFILVDAYFNHNPNFNTFNQSIGGNPALVRENRHRQMTASEAGHIMRQIHAYIETDTEYSRHFQYSLLNSDVPIIIADYPIAQKYGHWYGAFHDMAIVYASSPYILVIMSNMYHAAPHHAFEEISLFIQNFNNRYFRR
ncbi:MAG: class A beta-lactamase-related serine hydrolase [Defluviitaleaceae bacterium]|nr:class A beta-lactamase-related serine hydrolase [Defluviitaleaceae bacterium]